MSSDERTAYTEKYKDTLFDEKYGLKDAEGKALTASDFWQKTYGERIKLVN